MVESQKTPKALGSMERRMPTAKQKTRTSKATERIPSSRRTSSRTRKPMQPKEATAIPRTTATETIKEVEEDPATEAEEEAPEGANVGHAAPTAPHEPC